MRLRLFQIIQRAQSNDQVSRWYDFFIVTVAFVSIVPLMFKSEQISPFLDNFLNVLDIVTVFILFADYIFRWATYDIKSGYGKLSFIIYPFTPMAIIDLLAILPSFTILHDSLKFLRILRVVRILRMFNGLTVMTNVFIRERKALTSILFFFCVYVFSVGLIMFTIEPDTFDTFLDAFYWSTTALATIGYGDIAPVTDFGRTIAVISSLIGIAIIAFPAGIITAGYIRQMDIAKKRGKEYFEPPLKHDKIFKGKQITKYKSISEYIKKNKKVLLYTSWIVFGVIVTCVTEYVVYHNPYMLLYFDEFGAILISIILEPTAGLIVVLLSETIEAIYYGSASVIVYYGIGAMYCIVFGIYFRRGRKITAKSIFMVILVCVVLNTLYIFFVMEPLVPDYFEGWDTIPSIIYLSNFLDISYEFTYYISYFIERFIYSAFCILCIVLLRNYFWGSRRDPMMKIPARKRYRYKIYYKGKNEHSYIQTWLELYDEDEEDYSSYQAIVEQGKKSIEKTKKSIEQRKTDIEEMQKEVQERISAIQHEREELAKAEASIDVKRRAVKRVRRAQRIKESDLKISNIAEAAWNRSVIDENAPGAETIGNADSFEPVESFDDTGKIPPVKKEAKHKKEDKS